MPVGSFLAQFSATALGILGALALLSVFAAAVVLVKLMQFRAERVGRSAEAARAMALLRAGDPGGALAQARAGQGLRLRALAEILDTRAGPEDARLRATQVAVEGLAGLSRFLRGLEAVVQAAPMLGLLGTVVGMIEAFATLAATSGAADPSVLAGGIWTALLTTAIGLAIAIVFYFASLWLESRVSAERAALDSLLVQALAGIERR